MIELINYKDNQVVGNIQIKGNSILSENPVGCFKKLPENIKKFYQGEDKLTYSLEDYCLYTAKSLSNSLAIRDGEGISVKFTQVDSDPVRPGYTWVNDRTVKGGGFFRKGEKKKKDIPAPDANKVSNQKLKSQHPPDDDAEGPGISMARELLEVDTEQQAQTRSALISLMDSNITLALDSIKRVHSLSGLPEFDIDLTYDEQNSTEAGGMTVRGGADTATGNARLAFNGMSLNLATPERLLKIGVPMKNVKEFAKLTVIHEIGHTVDLTILGKAKNRFASAEIDILGNNLPNSADPEVAPLMTKLKDSQGAAKIRDGAGTDPNLKAYSNYLLTDNELFARGYTQYIATKTGDRALVANIQNYGISVNRLANRTPLGHGHWDTEEFNSTIMPEFDRVFANKGLLK